MKNILIGVCLNRKDIEKIEVDFNNESKTFVSAIKYYDGEISCNTSDKMSDVWKWLKDNNIFEIMWNDNKIGFIC